MEGVAGSDAELAAEVGTLVGSRGDDLVDEVPLDSHVGVVAAVTRRGDQATGGSATRRLNLSMSRSMGSTCVWIDVQ